MSQNAHAKQNAHAGKHAGKKEPLTPRQRATIPILAGANSVAAAARMSRVSRRTLHRWLKDEEFRQKLAEQGNKSGQLAHLQLQEISLRAVIALTDALEDPNPALRMRAIRTSLDFSGKFSGKFNEAQLLHEEIQALEDALPAWVAHFGKKGKK